MAIIDDIRIKQNFSPEGYTFVKDAAETKVHVTTIRQFMSVDNADHFRSVCDKIAAQADAYFRKKHEAQASAIFSSSFGDKQSCIDITDPHDARFPIRTKDIS